MIHTTTQLADYCRLHPELGISALRTKESYLFCQEGRFVAPEAVKALREVHDAGLDELLQQESERFESCPLLGIQVYAEPDTKRALYLQEGMIISQEHAHGAREAYDRYVQLRLQGDLASLDQAVQLAEQYFPQHLLNVARESYAKRYREAPDDEWYRAEAGVDNFFEVSWVEEEFADVERERTAA